MKTISIASGILLINLALAPGVKAETLDPAKSDPSARPVAYASATELNDRAPLRYCKVLPPRNDSPICEEECCEAADKEMPMTDCHIFAYPCHTMPPL